MSLELKIESVTPEKAHAYLALSAGNRKLSVDTVLAYTVDMQQGRWIAEASEILFDEAGKLIDGHHRLQAIIDSGTPQHISVKRGVPVVARAVVDTGKSRNPQDLFGMYRPKEEYVTLKLAIVNMCNSMLLDRIHAPKVKTFGAFDSWYRFYKDGTEQVIEQVVQLPSRAHWMRAPVAAAFVFAYPTDPTRVMAFLKISGEGEHLTKTMPAFSLRTMVLAGVGREARSARRNIGYRVLNAIAAHLDGRELKAVAPGLHGVERFRKAYDTKRVTQQSKPWGLAVAQEPESFEATP